MHQSSNSPRTFLPLFALLALSTVFNAILTLNDFHLLSSLRGFETSGNQPGKNEAPLSLLPVLQLVEANGHYGMNADREWETLLPPNYVTGLLFHSTDKRRHFISVYYQISCLNSLRKLYMNPGWEDDIEKQDGAHHCLNVLRQAVLCNGDTTLEPSHSELRSNGKEVAAASGMDVLHVCRNWEELKILSEVVHHSG